MWKLNKPSLLDAQNDIDEAFPNNPRVSIKKTDKDELKLIYDHYDKNNGKSDNKYKISNVISSTKATTIKNAYTRTQGHGDLSYIRIALLKTAKYKCAFCGQNERLTLDHYLPESEYKLVAINRQNLVPICFNCNLLKNAKPAADFIHVYYDILPEDQFLIANIQIQGLAINITFDIDAKAFDTNRNNPLFFKCLNQIKHIQLEDRINEILSGFLAQTFMNDGDIVDNQVLKMTMKVFINNHEKLYGVNDWRTVVLRALEQDGNFTIDFLKLYMQTNNEDVFS